MAEVECRSVFKSILHFFILFRIFSFAEDTPSQKCSNIFGISFNFSYLCNRIAKKEACDIDLTTLSPIPLLF